MNLHEQEKEKIIVYPFADLVVDTVLSPTMGISKKVNLIDLESIERSGNELLAETRSDPKKRERGRLYTVRAGDRNLYESQSFVGEVQQSG